MTPGDVICETPGGPVAVTGAGPIVPLIRHLAPAWPVHRRDDTAPDAVVSARFDGENWWFDSTSYESPEYSFPTGLPAANGLVGALLGSMLGLRPTWFTLHAAAVEIDHRLVLIAGANMAGKSTLATALAARGHRLWSDDRVLIMPDDGDNGFQAMALGLAAKVRLPLPEGAPASYRRWVEDRRKLVGDGMMYLQTGLADMAAAGQMTRPARLLIPDRDPGRGDTGLDPLSAGQVVKYLVPACYAPLMAPVARLQMLARLAGTLDAAVLQYQDAFSLTGEQILSGEGR